MDKILLVLMSGFIFVIGAASTLSIQKESIALKLYVNRKNYKTAALYYNTIKNTFVGYYTTVLTCWMLYFATKLRDLDANYLIASTVVMWPAIVLQHIITVQKYNKLLKHY